MKKKLTPLVIPEEKIINKILVLREEKVMLDVESERQVPLSKTLRGIFIFRGTVRGTGAM
jgi:hypothetical protein